MTLSPRVRPRVTSTDCEPCWPGVSSGSMTPPRVGQSASADCRTGRTRSSRRLGDRIPTATGYSVFVRSSLGRREFSERGLTSADTLLRTTNAERGGVALLGGREQSESQRQLHVLGAVR